MYDLIIIGAGPAGLTAGLYAGRARLKTIILEKMIVGGRILMTENIENFPGFPAGVSTQELIQNMEKQVNDLGVEIASAKISEISCKEKIVKTNEESYTAKAVIIASGAFPRKLGVPNEERLTAKGVSYCATCDGPLYREKNVVIVGGGDAVAEEALYLARFVKQVNIVHRRGDLRASPILQERLRENKKINFILNSVVTEICGANKVEAVKIKDLNSSAEGTVPCDGVFVYIGYLPDTDFAKGQIEMDEAGFIITGEGMGASCEGIFAAGDCRKKSLYQVITACSDGATAVHSACKYLTNNKT